MGCGTDYLRDHGRHPDGQWSMKSIELKRIQKNCTYPDPCILILVFDCRNTWAEVKTDGECAVSGLGAPFGVS
jgi:hypothetical protein